MDLEGLEDYVSRSRSIIDQSPQMDEQNTKTKLIQPLIDVIGWDIYSSEVELEFPVKMGRSSKKVDFAMLLNDTPVLFVEAKGLDNSISTSDKDQLASYMRQEGVNWGLLSNGEKFRILKRKKNSEKPEELSLGEFNIEELNQHQRVLETLSKESIESGESENIAETIQKKREAVKELKRKKEKLSQEVAQLITTEIGRDISQKANEKAKTYMDELIESLKSQTHPKTRETINMKGKTKTGGKRSWQPKKGANAISGNISRENINPDSNAVVAIFASHESGIDFIKENNAWGFVALGREPDYAAIYVTSESKVKYFADIKNIVPASQAQLARPPESYVDSAKFDSNKKVVYFKNGSLKKLDEPINYQDRAPQGRQYSSLREFREAETTKDII